MKWIAALCGQLALAVIVIMAAPVATQAGEPYEIHVVEPLTGNSSFVGNGQKQMLEIAAATINKDGGIKGRPLKFTFHDDQTTPQLTVQIVNEIIATHPAVILGMGAVAACNAVTPLVANGPFIYCFTPGAHPAAGSYVFSSCVNTLGLIKAAVRYYRLKGWTKLAMISSSDATGQEIDRGIDEVLALPENRGMTMVEHPHFNIGDVSVAAQIERIKAAGPQAMIAWTTGASISTIFKAMIQAGLDIPIVTTNGNQSFPQMSQYVSFLPRQLLIASALFPEHDGIYQLDPRVEKAQHAMYAALAAENLKADNMTTITWDVAMMVTSALRERGPEASAAQIRDYIANLTDYPGINGVFDFKTTPQRGLTDDDAIITRFDPQQKAWVWLSKPGGAPL